MISHSSLTVVIRKRKKIKSRLKSFIARRPTSSFFFPSFNISESRQLVLGMKVLKLNRSQILESSPPSSGLLTRSLNDHSHAYCDRRETFIPQIAKAAWEDYPGIIPSAGPRTDDDHQMTTMITMIKKRGEGTTQRLTTIRYLILKKKTTTENKGTTHSPSTYSQLTRARIQYLIIH